MRELLGHPYDFIMTALAERDIQNALNAILLIIERRAGANQNHLRHFGLDEKKSAPGLVNPVPGCDIGRKPGSVRMYNMSYLATKVPSRQRAPIKTASFDLPRHPIPT